VKQVISDLNFENKRAGKKGATSDRLGGTFCKVARDSPELTAAAKNLRDEPAADAGGAKGDYWVWNHVTGRRRRTRWKVVDPNAPLPVVRATPGAQWAWKHWERGDLLTVRELARIFSYSDEFKFTGSLESQYRQVTSTPIPPSLVKMIAGKMKQCLMEQQTETSNETGAVKANVVAPKLEAESDISLLMGVDSLPHPPLSARKRRFEEDVPTGAPHSNPSAFDNRLVRPRLDTN